MSNSKAHGVSIEIVKEKTQYLYKRLEAVGIEPDNQ